MDATSDRILISGEFLSMRVGELLDSVTALERDCSRLRPLAMLVNGIALALMLLFTEAILFYRFPAFVASMGGTNQQYWYWCQLTSSIAGAVLYVMILGDYLIDKHRIPPGFRLGWFGPVPAEAWKLIRDGLNGSGLAEDLLQESLPHDEWKIGLRGALQSAGNRIGHYTQRERIRSEGGFACALLMLWLLGAAALSLFGNAGVSIVFAPAVVVPILFELLYARYLRYIYFMPLLQDYLLAGLSHYRESRTTEIPRAESGNAPSAVQVQPGIDSMIRLAGYLRSELNQRDRLTAPRMAPISAAVGFLCVMGTAASWSLVLADDPPQNGVLGALPIFIGLLLCATVWWFSCLYYKSCLLGFRRRIRQAGMLGRLASGDISGTRLTKSCPPPLSHFLGIPLARTIGDAARFREAWQLMWNLDWFLREEGSSIRPDWLASVLMMVLWMFGPIVSFFSAMVIAATKDSNESHVGWVFLLIQLAACFTFVWASTSFTRHTAGAHAVVEELEELVQAGKE